MGKKRGRPKGEDEPTIQILSLRGKAAWRSWLERFANHLGMSTSKLVDVAVKEKAKREKFEPPPNRTGDEK